MTEASQDRDRFKSHADVVHTEKSNLEKVRVSLCEQVDSLTTENEKLKAANNELQRQRDNLEDDKEDLEREKERLIKELQRSAQVIEQLEGENLFVLLNMFMIMVTCAVLAVT